jgi:tRNA pseudouridine38-40 synthase
VNIKVVLEYDGSAFAGWQLQPRRRTVEAELRRALSRLPGAESRLQAAGRTDAGAHALGQVAGFQFSGGVPVSRLAAALNAWLPEDVSVLSAEAVPDGFHPRFSARWRSYRYRYLDRPTRPAVGRQYCWQVPRRLDVELMREGAKHLVGRHDWTSFCSAAEPARERVRELREATVARRGRYVELELVAEGFLRGLARGIAGALAEVGSGRRPPGWVAELLAARDRRQAPRTAPARGLTLMEVIYE